MFYLLVPSNFKSWPSALTPLSENPLFDFPAIRKSSDAAGLLQALKEAIVNSDALECWSDMAAVLLWVALTAGAAGNRAGNKVLEKRFRALVVRISLVL